MLDLLMSVFDEQHQFQDIWQLKTIRFDVNLDIRRSYEHNLGISSGINDIKGNPESFGTLFISNLRLVWFKDHEIFTNLSIGLDTINSVVLSSRVSEQAKHQLKIKAKSPSNSKYEFVFEGNLPQNLKIFKRVQQIHKKCQQTMNFRNIDLHASLGKQQLIKMQGQILTSQHVCKFSEDSYQSEVTMFLTNIRLVICKNKSGLNYSIPWIMIKSYEVTENNEEKAFKMHFRGVKSSIQIFIIPKKADDFLKIRDEIISLSQTYNNHPILGLESFEKKENYSITKKVREDYNEIQESIVCIKRNKQAYFINESMGNIKQTEYNEQLGIMMQKLPQNVTRQSLWNIIND